MQDINDIKFPSRKKTLEFFKGFRLDKDAADPDVDLEVNLDCDRFALSPEQAFQHLIDIQGGEVLNPILERIYQCMEEAFGTWKDILHPPEGAATTFKTSSSGVTTMTTGHDSPKVSDWIFVVVKISIDRDQLAGSSLVSDADGTEHDCGFNKDAGYISLTLRGRTFKSRVTNYDVENIEVKMDKGTERLSVKKLKLKEIKLGVSEE